MNGAFSKGSEIILGEENKTITTKSREAILPAIP
jgi:hypothetical protein